VSLSVFLSVSSLRQHFYLSDRSFSLSFSSCPSQCSHSLSLSLSPPAGLFLTCLVCLSSRCVNEFSSLSDHSNKSVFLHPPPLSQIAAWGRCMNLSECVSRAVSDSIPLHTQERKNSTKSTKTNTKSCGFLPSTPAGDRCKFSIECPSLNSFLHSSSIKHLCVYVLILRLQVGRSPAARSNSSLQGRKKKGRITFVQIWHRCAESRMRPFPSPSFPSLFVPSKLLFIFLARPFSSPRVGYRQAGRKKGKKGRTNSFAIEWSALRDWLN